MNSLPTDVILHIGSFLAPTGALALTLVNKQARARSEQLLKEQFQKVYGAISLENKPDRKSVVRLLGCAEKQPNAAVKLNIPRTPTTEVEKWKWLSGVENSLDTEFQKNYDDAVHLLKNTQATSIIQLKNQMMGFWHLDRQMKNYKKFKSEQIALSKGIISLCVGKVASFYCPPQVLKIEESLEDRSLKTYAKIGNFELDEKSYVVVAFHILGDENSCDKYRNYQNETEKQFISLTYGKTHIGIFDVNQPHLLTSLGYFGTNQSFTVLIGRMTKEEFCNYISSEKNVRHGERLVLDSQRYLNVDNDLVYRGRTTDIQGSDRILDQKLTQIMAEMVMQNQNIISIKVNSCHDDLPVLTAGGFTSYRATDVMKELDEFRSKEGNKLFPPYKNYLSVDTQLEKNKLNDKSVSYSKGAPESWIDIIKKEPILKANAGVLPEYWAVKPNIAQEECLEKIV